MADGHTPPADVRATARRGLELRRRYGRGGLDTQQAGALRIGSGVRRAADLAAGRAVSGDTIRRMVAFFSRHAKNWAPDKREADGGPTAGTIAHYLWGGPTGERWAKGIYRQMNEATKETYRLQSTQINADPEVTQRVRLFQRIFDPADLTEDGLETNPHITVFYGLDGVTAEQVAQAVRGRTRAFQVEFEDISLFENQDADVVKVDVESPQLDELHAALAKLPNQNERTIYQPHLTLAYVKPGTGRKYLINPLDDFTMRVDRIIFSDTDGRQVEIPLSEEIEQEEQESEGEGEKADGRLSTAKALRTKPMGDGTGPMGTGPMRHGRCALCGQPAETASTLATGKVVSTCKKCAGRLQNVAMKPGMPGGLHGPGVKNPAVYDALRKRGYDKSAAAAISNSLTAHSKKEHEVGTAVGLTVYKQADGSYRWVTRSSNAFRDRDGEIVSTKALAEDVALADKTKEYGPLRFWHMPGVDLGDCDFNWLRGRTLIESGTFRDPAVAQKVARKADQYQVSIGFRHPHDEPDAQGVFHTIRRFERSLVPAGRAANPFTSLTVSKEKAMNDTIKQAALKALLEDDEAQLKAIMAGADSSEKTADQMGIAFKEADLNALSLDELLDYAIAAKEAEIAKEAQKATPPPAPEKADPGMDYATKMDGCVQKMDGLITKMGGYMDSMEKMFGSRKKEADDVTAVTVATNAHSERLAKLESELAAKTKELESLVATVKELKAEVPAGLGDGVRPTERTDNIDPEAEATKQVGGSGKSPVDAFLNGFVLGGMN